MAPEQDAPGRGLGRLELADGRGQLEPRYLFPAHCFNLLLQVRFVVVYMPFWCMLELCEGHDLFM